MSTQDTWLARALRGEFGNEEEWLEDSWDEAWNNRPMGTSATSHMGLNGAEIYAVNDARFSLLDILATYRKRAEREFALIAERDRLRVLVRAVADGRSDSRWWEDNETGLHNLPDGLLAAIDSCAEEAKKWKK